MPFDPQVIAHMQISEELWWSKIPGNKYKLHKNYVCMRDKEEH